MLLENKKVKTISEAFGLPEDTIKAILDAYVALTLYNIIDYKEDETIFGNVTLDFENKKLNIEENSEFIENIFKGSFDYKTFKRFLLLSDKTKV